MPNFISVRGLLGEELEPVEVQLNPSQITYIQNIEGVSELHLTDGNSIMILSMEHEKLMAVLFE
ncbi:hypothetical protein ABV409_07250 [Flagellimonas sp. DF-77]|uniref:hypothetical protein n=1 Tax=Flagellimonas algarum TaxID=3230298 RepID=UPI003391475B